jgi:cobalamin biosynthesis protein CbiG
MMTLGIGLSSRAGTVDVRSAAEAVLAVAGWRWQDVAVIGTASRLANDSRLAATGRPVVGFDHAQLASMAVPTPPGPTLSRLAIPAVAEAAALLAAGPGARIVVPKQTGRYITVAAAASSPVPPALGTPL